MTRTRSERLRTLAQRVADGLPVRLVEEVVLTGSVSRGMADEASDIEMLVVTTHPLELEECFGLAGAAGLERLGTWGTQGGPAHHVSGRCEDVPLELTWWPHAYADERIDALLAGKMASTADALVNGLPLLTCGLLASWQQRLAVYPSTLATAQIEAAALPWGGFAPAALLTALRPGDRLALLEWAVDGASRVLTIIYALNRVWQPTVKRLAVRLAALPVKPERLAERIEEALTEPDARRALLVLTELQLETVQLAPRGPNIDRARAWLAEGTELLRAAPSSPV